MKSKELLNEVMEELELTEELDIMGGSAYSVARGLACIYSGIMGIMGYSCSDDRIGLSAGAGISGNYICTHR